MFVAPANSIKLNMLPISSYEKLKGYSNEVTLCKMLGLEIPTIINANELNNANNIKPIAEGIFK